MQPDNSPSLSISTFNCRSVKSSITEIYDLCCVNDFVFIQEHWLLPFELDVLNNLHPSFLATSKSAVDVTSDVLIGRPYGGTAILFRKELSGNINVIESHNERICAITFATNIGPVLFVCVYMPVDLGDVECYSNYVGTCSAISALYAECDAAHLVVIGDFNCQFGSRFYDIYTAFAEDHHLKLSDINRLSDVFTYCRDNGACSSWIDHCLCSNAVDEYITSINVLYQYISSDHKPLTIIFNGLAGQIYDSGVVGDNASTVAFDWSRADTYCLQQYESLLTECLNRVNVPYDILDVDFSGNIVYTHAKINDCYNEVVSCIKIASQQSIPSHIRTYADHIVPGWNEYVKDKHTAAREAFLQWVVMGKPRQGIEHWQMSRTRAVFKLALRYCKQNVELMRADAYANSLTDKDYKSFWSDIHKFNNANCTKYANTIGNCHGDADITDMWYTHFKSLYNSLNDVESQAMFNLRLSKLTEVSIEEFDITLQDMRNALNKQCIGKAVGPDDIAMEALIYGGNKLLIHLCFLFNLFVKHGYMPRTVMHSLMVPLVKCKSGDLSDVNNYRAIAISTAVSKLFEHVVSDAVQTATTGSSYDKYQFGFKEGHSTSLCTNILKSTVDYYINRGSHVFVCFVDFSKAFDNVNYWKLFNKMLDENVNSSIVRILAYWYSHQEVCVRWHSTVSMSFTISNGTRQGGVLSPMLFNFYIRDLLQGIASSRLGCNIGGMFINILAYADDIVLIAPAWQAMSRLLGLLCLYSKLIDMTCNTKKTVCMIFNPKDRSKVVSTKFPPLTIDNVSLQYVPEFKYLGHIISNDFMDDRDIQREMCNMFFRTNLLVRRFSRCSTAVKVTLFRAYCICFYDTALWKLFSVTAFNKMMYCYHKCIKIFFGFKRRDSVTNILCQLRLPSFSTLIANGVAVFQKCYIGSDNELVCHLRRLGY